MVLRSAAARGEWLEEERYGRDRTSGGSTELRRFADDGRIPNNPSLPLVIYRLALPKSQHLAKDLKQNSRRMAGTTAGEMASSIIIIITAIRTRCSALRPARRASRALPGCRCRKRIRSLAGTASWSGRRAERRAIPHGNCGASHLGRRHVLPSLRICRPPRGTYRPPPRGCRCAGERGRPRSIDAPAEGSAVQRILSAEDAAPLMSGRSVAVSVPTASDTADLGERRLHESIGAAGFARR